MARTKVEEASLDDVQRAKFEALRIGSCQLEVESLVSGRQTSDPKLYDAILLLNKQLEVITQALSPLVRKSLGIVTGISDLPSPQNFICFSTKLTVRFTWSQVTYASQYEVREGTVWETASFRFRTSGLQGDIDPLLYGDYTFLIKTLDSEGNYSLEPESTNISVPLIPAPQITVSVVDNNVLLTWTEPESTFKIDYYLLAKEGGIEGKVNGTFTTIFEIVAGTYNYTVVAVDVAGNRSDTATVSAQVNQPPDFALQESRVSGLNGTRDDVLRLPVRPSLLACYNYPQTWQEHYRVFNNFMRPKDQVDAGYPIYIQPTDLDGWYEEVIDYGTVITNTIITITWNSYNHAPLFTVNVVVKMAVSTDGVDYTDFIAGSSQYYRNLRYLKLRLEFVSENDKALLELYNLTISLNVKRENDGGEVNAVSTDAGGTVVYFTKPFKDVESITCTTKSPIEPFVVIFDFVDAPNPTLFKVFVFDTMGARVSRLIDWKARGIV